MPELGSENPREGRWTVPEELGPDAPTPVGEDLDAALGRLEDLLLSLPFDRALPNLGEILAQAGVTREQLRSDDRTWKVLHEAVVARPLSDIDEVAALQTEVELLTLEVGVLTERLQEPTVGRDEVRRADRRLDDVRRQLERVRRQL